MVNKQVDSLEQAMAGIFDGATILIGGFGGAGHPTDLIHALIDQGAGDLIVVNNNAGNYESGLAALIKAGRVRKMVCSFPKASNSHVFNEMYAMGKIELECVPQGTIAERLHAGAAGLGGFYTPTAYGTDLAHGKECRELDGKFYVFEKPLRGDFALINAEQGDRWGNLVYRKAARNFNPLMCKAAEVTIAQVKEVVALGELDPEHIITPGVFVNRLIEIPQPTFSA